MERYPSINVYPDIQTPEQTEPEKLPDYVPREPSRPAQPAYSPSDQNFAPSKHLYQPVPQQQYHYPQPHVPAPVPPQARMHAPSVLLPSLNMSPATVDCPFCGVRAVTSINYEAGNQTQSVSPFQSIY
jgi:LITAF-like zinc ribbon domain